MKTSLFKSGNSFAVRIPKHIVEDLQLHLELDMLLEVAGDNLVLKPTVKKYKLRELLKDFDSASNEWDTGKPVGNEEW